MMKLWMKVIVTISLLMAFGLGACGTVIRGVPEIPQQVVDAIAGETVKYYEKQAPPESLLIETAKLDLYWGEILPQDEADYSEVICFRAEVQYLVMGQDSVIYYHGIVKKPLETGGAWFIDQISAEIWQEYGCGGDFMLMITPTPVGAETEPIE